MPCVYTTPEGLCKGTAPLHPNEHYLPRALGNFKNNEPLVNRSCNDPVDMFKTRRRVRPQ